MAPQAYVDTYQTYKQGTKRITTWLVQTSKRCSADVSFLDNSISTPPGAAKSKPKATKQATTTYEIPLKEFRRLASGIAASTSPKVSLPNSTAALIRSVISLRKQANNFFAKLSSSTKDRVLQEVLDTLEAAPTTDGKDDTTALNNLFEALKVDDTEEDDGSSVPVLIERKSSKKHPQPEYELEAVALDEIFTIFTVFKDVNDMRDYIKGVWSDYRYKARVG